MPTTFYIDRKTNLGVFEDVLNDGKELRDADTIMGCCTLVGREVFDRIGLLDERFFLTHEESEFCLRARQRHLRIAFLDELLVWHKGSSTFRWEGLRLSRYYDAKNLWWMLGRAVTCGSAYKGRLSALSDYTRHVYFTYAYEERAGHIPERAVLGRSGERPRLISWARPFARVAIQLGWSIVWRRYQTGRPQIAAS